MYCLHSIQWDWNTGAIFNWTRLRCCESPRLHASHDRAYVFVTVLWITVASCESWQSLCVCDSAVNHCGFIWVMTELMCLWQCCESPRLHVSHDRAYVFVTVLWITAASSESWQSLCVCDSAVNHRGFMWVMTELMCLWQCCESLRLHVSHDRAYVFVTVLWITVASCESWQSLCVCDSAVVSGRVTRSLARQWRWWSSGSALCTRSRVQLSTTSVTSAHVWRHWTRFSHSAAFSGPLVQWTTDPLDHWTIGPVVQWSIGPLVHWYIGPVVHWSNDPLDHWSTGPLVQWTIGPMVQWSTDQLDHWSTDPLVHWSIGPVVHWSNDPLDHWWLGALGGRPHNPATWFYPSTTTVVSPEPFPHRPRALRCL